MHANLGGYFARLANSASTIRKPDLEHYALADGRHDCLSGEQWSSVVVLEIAQVRAAIGERGAAPSLALRNARHT